MASSFVRKKLFAVLVVVLLVDQGNAEVATRVGNMGSTTSGGKTVTFDFTDLPDGSVINTVGVVLSLELWETSSNTQVSLSGPTHSITLDAPGYFSGVMREVIYADSASMVWQTLSSFERSAAHYAGNYSMKPYESFSWFNGDDANASFDLTVEGVTVAGGCVMTLTYTSGGGSDDGDPDDGGPDDPDSGGPDDPDGGGPDPDLPDDPDDGGPDDPDGSDDDGPDDDGSDPYDGNNDGIDQSGDNDTTNYGAVLPDEFTSASDTTFNVDLKRAAGSGQDSGMWSRGDGTYGTGFIGGFGNISASDADGGDHSVSLPIYTGPLASLGSLDVSIMPPDYWPATEVYALLSALLGAGLLFKLTRTVRQY